MKAKDLMIGDWVRLKKFDFNKKIAGMNDKMVRFHNCSFWDVQDLVEPIPLTAEILEENGFENKTHIVWHDIYILKYRIELANKELEQDQTLMLAKDPYNVFYWIPEMSAVSALNFRYVHELQHILRLCQIDKEIII